MDGNDRDRPPEDDADARSDRERQRAVNAAATAKEEREALAELVRERRAEREAEARSAQRRVEVWNLCKTLGMCVVSAVIGSLAAATTAPKWLIWVVCALHWIRHLHVVIGP